jgi:hypothetical protein
MLTKQVNELKILSCQTTKSQSNKNIQDMSHDLSKFIKLQSKISNAEKEDEDQDQDEED